MTMNRRHIGDTPGQLKVWWVTPLRLNMCFMSEIEGCELMFMKPRLLVLENQ